MSVVVTYSALSMYGSESASLDFAVEKLIALPIGLVVLMVSRFLWSWATAPRHIYGEQQRKIEDLAKSLDHEIEYKKNSPRVRAAKAELTETINAGERTFFRDVGSLKYSAWLPASNALVDRILGLTEAINHKYPLSKTNSKEKLIAWLDKLKSIHDDLSEDNLSPTYRPEAS